MWDVLGIALIVTGAWAWVDSLRARERALQAGRSACARHGLQFLDDTVAFARLRLARDADGRVRLARTYTFEFTETGNTRRAGSLVLLGDQLQALELEPYRMKD